MNTNKYIYLTLYIILGFIIDMLAPPILSYSHTDYSFYYLVFRMIYRLSKFLIFIGIVALGVIEFSKLKGNNIGYLLKKIIVLCLPVLAILLCNKINNALYQDGLPWHIPYILKLHSAQYEKDINKFYQENLETVAKETYVLKFRSMPPGFPAYQAQYEMFRAQDSTFNISVRYCVNPLRRNKTCYVYFSGNTTDMEDTLLFRKWTRKRYHLWGNWYYCVAKS